MRLLFLFLLVSLKAQAQSAFAPENQIPIEPQRMQESIRHFNVTDSALPNLLQKAFLHYQNISAPDCSSASAFDYALSLTIKGDYKSCSEFVFQCAHPNAALVIQGARCAALDFNYILALEIFKNGLSTNPQFPKAYYLEYATLARYSLAPEKTEAILDLNPEWTSAQKKQALGFVEMAGNTQPTNVSKNDVFNFIEEQLKMANDFDQQYLKAWRINIYTQDYQFEKAYQYLVQDAATLANPLDWWNSGFSLLYKLKADGFAPADSFYQAFLPYAHMRSLLPKENNTFDYSMIRSSVCKDSFLQGAELTELKTIISRWKNSQASLSDSIAVLQKKPENYFSKSDFLSALGGLLSMNKQSELAQNYFWKAHQLCPYNNRAHWGIVLLQRQKKYSQFPEFAANEKRVTDTLQKITFPPETQNYFANWNSLLKISQDRVKYAARIWAPYLKALLQSGSKSYIKPPFEILSTSPGFSMLRDQRISYPFDNRLWDDVRGAGGASVAADHDEVFLTVQGDYNLLGHEMAHQFHNYVTSAEPRLNDCIQNLYDAATARDLFPDAYAKGNVKEYFAQGVTYYLVPADSPARFGINVSWIKKNDPDLYNFIVSIDSSNGDLKKIICPISL